MCREPSQRPESGAQFSVALRSECVLFCGRIFIVIHQTLGSGNQLRHCFASPEHTALSTWDAPTDVRRIASVRRMRSAQRSTPRKATASSPRMRQRRRWFAPSVGRRLCALRPRCCPSTRSRSIQRTPSPSVFRTHRSSESDLRSGCGNCDSKIHALCFSTPGT